MRTVVAAHGIGAPGGNGEGGGGKSQDDSSGLHIGVEKTKARISKVKQPKRESKDGRGDLFASCEGGCSGWNGGCRGFLYSKEWSVEGSWSADCFLSGEDSFFQALNGLGLDGSQRQISCHLVILMIGCARLANACCMIRHRLARGALDQKLVLRMALAWSTLSLEVKKAESPGVASSLAWTGGTHHSSLEKTPPPQFLFQPAHTPHLSFSRVLPPPARAVSISLIPLDVILQDRHTWFAARPLRYMPRAARLTLSTYSNACPYIVHMYMPVPTSAEARTLKSKKGIEAPPKKKKKKVNRHIHKRAASLRTSITGPILPPPPAGRMLRGRE